MRRALFTTLLSAGAILVALTSNGFAAPQTAGADLAAFGPVALPAMSPGATVSVDVTVTNAGTATWSSPNVYLAYHWYTDTGALVVWDGARTALGASIAPGASRTVSAQVGVPGTPRTYTLSFELVREGVAWFGGALDVPARVEGATYRATYTVGAGASSVPGQVVSLPVTVTNVGTATWSTTGTGPVALAYHVYDASGNTVVWDGTRTSIGTALAPGQSRELAVAVRAPAAGGDFTVRVDAVREGLSWFSGLGSPGADVILRVPSAYGSIDVPQQAWAGANVYGTVEVTNATTTTWRATGTSPVRLSYHLYTAAGALELWDGERSVLPYDVAPGQSVAVPATLRAPGAAGDHVVAWDLVEEGVAWMSSRGVAAARAPLAVRALPSSLRGAEWYRIPTSDRVVALTFDCGANADGAQRILDTLAAKSVTATFFMCGNFVNTYPAMASTIASRYPVGDHTATHQDLRTLSDADVVTEILGGERTIWRVTGVDPHPLFRFPYGASDARTIALANAYGYGGIRWTVDTLGWEGISGGQSVQTVTQRVLASLTPGEIVLMHVGSNPDDRSTLDADALAGVIDAIRAQGYGFATITAYLP